MNFLLYLDIMFIGADSCHRRQEGHAVVPDVYLFERKSRRGDAGRLSFDKMIAPCYFLSDFFPDDTLLGFLLMKSFQLL